MRGLTALAAVVALFATVDAIRSRPAPLANTFATPAAAAEAVVAAMGAGDLDRLRALALSEEEFRDHVWPDLPASRPERNMPFAFVWGLLRERSEAFLHATAAAVRERTIAGRGQPRAGPTRPLAVADVQFAGETSTYGDVTVHRDARIVLAGPAGPQAPAEQTPARVRLFGAMVEQGGRWKVFSYVISD